jgi:hypothetical protein
MLCSAFKTMAAVLGFRDVTIAAVGMDHCQAARNAAKAAGAESVVDCFIHVDRCMLKNRGKLKRSDYIDIAREHIRMLAKITDRDIFQRGTDIALAEWRAHHENEFADWFQSVYLCKDWDFGSFHAGAGGIAGIPNHNQCDESLFRSIKRFIRTKATVEHFFERSVPDMLTHLGTNFSFDKINRGVEDQRGQITACHVHRDTLEKALAYCRQEESNVYMNPCGKRVDSIFSIWYVNASTHFYYEDGKNAITKSRVREFNDVQDEPCSIESFVERHCSLHKVVQHFPVPGNRDKFKLHCDCAYFWSGSSHCSHIVAVYHRIGIINIFDMVSKLAPVRKRGRPTTREKALERDRDVDIGYINPARWRKQVIRHLEYLTGHVYDTRTYETDKGKRVTVWKVRFPDAPGGMQDFEMEEEALKRNPSSATPSSNSGTAKSRPMMTMTARKTCYDAWLLLVASLSQQ